VGGKIIDIHSTAQTTVFMYWDFSSWMLCSPAVSKFQSLLVLEAEHGPLPGTTPAIKDFINYLENVYYAVLASSCF